MHRIVAFLALATHLIFVVFTLLGGFLAWLLPWVLVPHVLSAVWGARTVAGRRTCPLSVAENWGREGSGRERLDERGFLVHYLQGRYYPESSGRRVAVGVTTVVLGSWIGFVVR